jgi:hypothetical protein
LRELRLRLAPHWAFRAVLFGFDRGDQFGDRRSKPPSDGARRSLG